MWTVVNLGLVALVSLAVTLVYGLLNETRPGALGRVLFGWGIVFASILPGALLYLAALWMVPREWDERRRRRWALGLSPLVGLLVWLSLLQPGQSVWATIGFGLALSLSSGLAVRLPSVR
jgi:hypothetical protein